MRVTATSDDIAHPKGRFHTWILCLHIYTYIHISIIFFWNWIGNSSSLAFHSSISGWKFSTFLPHQIDLSTQGKYQKGDNKKTGHRQNYRVIILEKGVILERFFFLPQHNQRIQVREFRKVAQMRTLKGFFSTLRCTAPSFQGNEVKEL